MYTPPFPPSEECLLGKKWSEGGGRIKIFPWMYTMPWTLSLVCIDVCKRPIFSAFLCRCSLPPSLTCCLTALQRTIVDFFFEFAWGFGIEKWRGFLVKFLWSPFPRKQSTKSPRIFGENSEHSSEQNSGRKFEKFGNFSFCTFSDPIKWVPPGNLTLKKDVKSAGAVRNCLDTFCWLLLRKPTGLGRK